MKRSVAAFLVVLAGAGWLEGSPGVLDVQAIIARSAVAMSADWAAAPGYDYCEEDRDEQGTKTYAVTMIEVRRTPSWSRPTDGHIDRRPGGGLRGRARNHRAKIIGSSLTCRPGA